MFKYTDNQILYSYMPQDENPKITYDI